MEGVCPYSFEPRYSQTNLEKKNPGDIDKFKGRTGNPLWCSCGFCVQMQTDMESICCNDFEQICTVMGSCDCITLHSSFEKVVLNIDTLTAARYHLLLHASSYEKERLKETTNNLWRHIAYKQFVYWINGWVPLGKHNRKIIPSCVIRKIREEYPKADNNYTGFIPTQGEDANYFD